MVSILIVGNAICLAVGYNDLEWFFLAIFVVEALVKMYAFGFIEYFHHRWNIFDFTIIFVSTVYSLLSAFVKNCKEIMMRRMMVMMNVCSAIESGYFGRDFSRSSDAIDQTCEKYSSVR